MKTSKTTCHVCSFIVKTIGYEEILTLCELCGTNLKDPKEEVHVLGTTIGKEGGGIRAYEVHVILTNKRILFTGDESYDGTVETLGWLFGGIIGGLIGGTVDEAKSKNTRQISVKFEDITSLDVEHSTKLLNRNAMVFTICDKEGNTYFFQLGKDEAGRWETAIRNRFTIEQH